MDRIPLEVKFMIAFHLRNCYANPRGPHDIKQLRLINKDFSVAGAEYLLPEIHLTFQTPSFERLRTISEHPFFSQHVKQLRYEPDAFGKTYNSYHGWMKDAEASIIARVKPPVEPSEDEGKQAKLVYEEELEGFRRDKAAGLLELYERYRSYETNFSDQMTIRHNYDSYSVKLLAQAIARLPKLAEVTLNFERGVVPRSNAFKRAYAGSLWLPRGDDGHREPYGVAQLCSVLLGAAYARTKLKSLNCGKIDWKFLQAKERNMQGIKFAVRYLEYFRIMFYTGRGYLNEPVAVVEVANCYNFLRGYRMCELLSAAKNVKILSLSMDQVGTADLKYVVGTTTWASLRVVDFDSLETAEETLIEFLKRHAGTLKELGLNDIVLVEGDWISALRGIREAVTLEELRAVGSWWARNPHQCWDIDTNFNSLGLEVQKLELKKGFQLGLAVSKYVVEHHPSCPLLDLATYPMS